jgi:poly(A) polymerase
VTDERSTEDVIATVGKCFAKAGVEAYIVGGFVRDQLLGHTSKDIDIVCVNDGGIEALEAFARKNHWSKPAIFERFGTAQTRGDGFIVEVVRARRERYDPESRKPDVAPGTLEEDIMRRDFTVNALCQTFGGEILDLTGKGRADLQSGVLRTPLDAQETFSEDPLRMLRAARFVAQLGFQPAPGMLEAMRAQAERARLLSAERIRDELARLLTSSHVRDGMNLLRDSGLLDVAVPQLLDMVGVEQGGYHKYDVWDHTMYAVEASPPDLITRCAALFHDSGKPATHALAEDGKHTFYGHAGVGATIARLVMERLRFSNDEIEAVAKLVDLHLRPIQYDQESWSDSAVRRLIRDAGELRDQMIDLARADTVASSFPTTAGLDELALRMDALDKGGSVSKFVAPVSGNEIMALAGRKRGPWVGVVKRALEDAVIEGTLDPNDHDAAVEWLRSNPKLWSADEKS